MTHTKLVPALAVCLLLLPGPTYSQWAVVDVQSIVQSIKLYAAAIQQVTNQTTQIGQLDTAIQYSFKQVEAQTGTRGFGSLQQNDVYKSYRRQLPTETQQTLDNLTKGIYPTDKESLKQGLQGLVSIYRLWETANGTESQTELSNVRRDYRMRATASSGLAASTAETALASAARNTTNIEALIDQINDTPDIKASQDLTARISAENALMLNQLLSVQATHLSNQATQEINRQKDADFTAWKKGL